MAQQRLLMRKIRDVLRLSAAGMSKRQIAASLGIGPTAAGVCLSTGRAKLASPGRYRRSQRRRAGAAPLSGA